MPGDEKKIEVGSGDWEFKVKWVEPEQPKLPTPHPYIKEDDDENSLKRNTGL